MMSWPFFKSIIDKVFALVLLLILSPVILFVLLIIFLFMGRPLLFKQKRPGKDAKIFTIYKLRTMSNEKDEEGNLLPDAKRLSRLGKLIRSLSLDELPQLINILKGEMSFIGPRPLLVEYLPLYNEEQKKRHNVKPGITGWAQVNGRNAISWQKKFEYDVYYAENCSFFFDVKIAILSVIRIVQRDGINAENEVTTVPFKGNTDEQ